MTQACNGIVQPINEIGHQDDIKHPQVLGQVHGVSLQKAYSISIDFIGDFGNGILSQVAFDSESVRQGAFDSKLVGMFNESVRIIDTDYFVAMTRQLKGRAPDSASEVQCPWVISQQLFLETLGDTALRIVECFGGTLRVGTLFL